MKIAVIGITGRAGSRIAAEALARGHQVSGIARTPDAAKAPKGVTIHQGDATRPETVVAALKGADAVVSAARFVDLTANELVAALRAAGVRRVLVVGGAASLEAAPGVALLDTPGFPDAYKPEARAGKAFLEALRNVDDLDWTFLSPAAVFEPGTRTGAFRIGGDALLSDAAGKSRIAMEDYAIAALDELESPRHVRQRFSVAY